jgi:hypothetical protein
MGFWCRIREGKSLQSESNRVDFDVALKAGPRFFTFDVIFSMMLDIEPETSASKSKCSIGDDQQ